MTADRSPSNLPEDSAQEEAGKQVAGQPAGLVDSAVNAQPGDDQQDTTSLWTIPNALSAFRWFGAPLLIYLGATGREQGLVIWYFVLAASDWFDGKIAVRFHQRSPWGPRLDSWADATLYLSLLVGGLWLWHATLIQQWPWVASALGSYALATLAGTFKFGGWPSYHTATAKGSWGLVILAIIALAWDWAAWPLQLAMASVTLANIESLLITLRLDAPRSDVWSLLLLEREPTTPKSSTDDTKQQHEDSTE